MLFYGVVLFCVVTVECFVDKYVCFVFGVLCVLFLSGVFVCVFVWL